MNTPISDIAKNLSIKHNVTFRVIDKGTNQVVKEYKGHNQATNTMLTGVGHFLAGDAQFNQGSAMMGYFLPKYISLGTMGLINQDEDNNHLPVGVSGAGLPETADEAERYTAYMEQSPGYGADGYPGGNNNNRPALGLGPKFSGDSIGCELISESFPRAKITHREVIAETNAETPETVDVVLSAMISTGALAQFRGDNGYVFITEAGLWSQPKYSANGTSLLAGYRIKPPDEDNWDMTDANNRRILQENIIRVGINQVVQVVWKIQIGSVSQVQPKIPTAVSMVSPVDLTVGSIAYGFIQPVDVNHITVDLNDLERGDISSSGGNVSSNYYLRFKSDAKYELPAETNSIRARVTTTTSYTVRLGIAYYDSNNNFISLNYYYSNGEWVTIPLNAAKVRYTISFTNEYTIVLDHITSMFIDTM